MTSYDYCDTAGNSIYTYPKTQCPACGHWTLPMIWWGIVPPACEFCGHRPAYPTVTWTGTATDSTEFHYSTTTEYLNTY